MNMQNSLLSLAHVFEEEQLSFLCFLTNHIVILLYKKRSTCILEEMWNA